MPKKKNIKALMEWFIYIATTIITLGVAFLATSKGLIIPYIPSVVLVFAGWIVIIITVVGFILKIVDLFN